MLSFYHKIKITLRPSDLLAMLIMA